MQVRNTWMNDLLNKSVPFSIFPASAQWKNGIDFIKMVVYRVEEKEDLLLYDADFLKKTVRAIKNLSYINPIFQQV